MRMAQPPVSARKRYIRVAEHLSVSLPSPLFRWQFGGC